MRNEMAKIITQYPDGMEMKQMEKEVFVEKKSLTRAEFYAAYSSKLDLKSVFDICPDDYNECVLKKDGKKFYPSHMEYDGEIFVIARTYQKDMEGMEVMVR